MNLAHATAAQLAQALGAAKSTVIRRAAAEGWAFTASAGRGGPTKLYTVASLPAPVRTALAGGPAVQAAQAGQVEGARAALGSELAARAAQTQAHTALRRASELNAQAQARMDAKLAVLRALDLHCAQAPALSKAQARMGFALAYNSAQVDVDATVQQWVPSVSESTLERWQSELRTQGITALAGAYGNRAGTGLLDTSTPMREFVQAMLVQYPHARATQVLQGLQSRFTDQPLPSVRTLERWMGSWRHANREVVQALANPDAWKNKHMVAFGSKSEGVSHINARWERDSSPADVLCTDGRYTLIAGIDVFTRSAKILVAKTSKAVAVGAHLRAMLLEFGVPDADKTDNGSDYTARYTERVYSSLAILHELCPPFQPWHKPHIERFFGTFTRDLVELLPGFIGHSVAERKAIEARRSFADRLMQRGQVVELRMSGADLQAFCDQWVTNIYDRQPHEGLQQRSPFEVRAAHAHEVRRIEDQHALDILLAEAPGRDGRRTVRKKGIELEGGWFIAPELQAWVDQDVMVRFDPFAHDLGTVFVFGGDDMQFICIAQNPERTGMDRREVAVVAKRMQRERVQAERKALKAAAKRVGVDGIVGEILRERASAAGKLAQLPVRAAAQHQSSGLLAAAQAVAAATGPRRTTADVENLAEVQAMRERIAAEQVPLGQANELAQRRNAQGVPTPLFETPVQRVQWLLAQAHVRQLGLEEQGALAEFKRAQPASYHRIAEMVAEAEESRSQKEGPGRVAGGTGPV